jgi:uncharacterized protein (DUF1330 family)
VRKCGYGGRVTVYAIAQLKFTDRDAYNRYQAAFMEVFQRYDGTLLAVDEAPGSSRVNGTERRSC